MKNLKANRLLSIAVRTQGRALHGWLRRSERPLGLALLLAAPASSSERACLLAQARIASLAIDLESPEDAQHRPGMDQLCSRLYDVIQWLRGRADTRLLPLGCVAAGRNGAAAVIEAVRQPASMRGIALRDADLRDARPWLQRLSVPLFLHAGDDTALVEAMSNILEAAPADDRSTSPAHPPASRTACPRSASSRSAKPVAPLFRALH